MLVHELLRLSGEKKECILVVRYLAWDLASKCSAAVHKLRLHIQVPSPDQLSVGWIALGRCEFNVSSKFAVQGPRLLHGKSSYSLAFYLI